MWLSAAKQRSGGVYLRHAARVVFCQARPSTDRGTEKREKLCWKGRTAVVVVALSLTTRTSVGHSAQHCRIPHATMNGRPTLFGER